MKKKGIATLALAGALAVSMVPAFAANAGNNQASTTVGYTANGNVSTDGKVMVTVPKNVTFTGDATTVTGFDVKAFTWSDTQNSWQTPGANGAPALSNTIDVQVDSKNTTDSQTSFLLKTTNGTYSSTTGTYQYKIANKAIADNTAKNVGTLKNGVNDIQGTLEMTVKPVIPNEAGYVYFSDTLTFTFTGTGFEAAAQP